MTPNTALVTGGTRGIGRGITERLLADGFRVVVNGVRDQDALASTLGELAVLGDVTYVAADIGSADGRSHLVRETVSTLGHLNLLVNNAGITSPGRNDILDANEDDLDRVLAVNLKGPFFLTQQLAKNMIDHGGANTSCRGRIVNVTSISAAVASTDRAEYCISKAGLSMTTLLWASRLAEYGIDVFEVRPGIIETDMTAPVAEKYEKLIDGGLTLDRRLGTPSDVASVVSALAAGQIPYATGQVLTIDGGLSVARL